MPYYNDDYHYSREAQEYGLKIIWECNNCHRQREDYPGWNEGGQCYCGGEYEEAGEIYSSEPIR